MLVQSGVSSFCASFCRKASPLLLLLSGRAAARPGDGCAALGLEFNPSSICIFYYYLNYKEKTTTTINIIGHSFHHCTRKFSSRRERYRKEGDKRKDLLECWGRDVMWTDKELWLLVIMENVKRNDGLAIVVCPFFYNISFYSILLPTRWHSFSSTTCSRSSLPETQELANPTFSPNTGMIPSKKTPRQP